MKLTKTPAAAAGRAATGSGGQLRGSRRLLALCAMAAAVAAAVPAPASADTGDYGNYDTYMDRGPGANVPFADTDWVPQGMTKLGEDYLVISYYDAGANPGNSRLAVIDRRSGARTAWYELNTKGHVGGLAVTSKYLWVAQPSGADHMLWRYSRSKLTGGNGTNLTADTGFKVRASSYAFGQGETVWVGEFGDWDGSSCPTTREQMHQYTINSSGVPVWRWAFTTPPQVQGVAVTGNRFIWSTSCGRNANSKLIVGPALQHYDGTSTYKTIVAPNMAEGMVIASNELQIVFETASGHFADADYRIKKVEHGPISRF